MNRFVWISVFVIFSVAQGYDLLAQAGSKEKSVKDYIPTENVDPRKEANTWKNKPKRKNISYLYKDRSSPNILYGNPCFVEQTRRMGFEYVPNPQGLPGALNDDDQYSNNVLVNIKLIFTQSPFWKLILNRRVRKCREKSGDWTG